MSATLAPESLSPGHGTREGVRFGTTPIATPTPAPTPTPPRRRGYAQPGCPRMATGRHSGQPARARHHSPGTSRTVTYAQLPRRATSADPATGGRRADGYRGGRAG